MKIIAKNWAVYARIEVHYENAGTSNSDERVLIVMDWIKLTPETMPPDME